MVNWALIVGINDYGADSQLATLHGAVADAAEFAEWALDPAGGDVPPANLYFWCYGLPDAPGPRLTAFLANPTPWPQLAPDPTRAPNAQEICIAVDQAAVNARNAGADRLYIFFAGHGFQTQTFGYGETSQTCFVAGGYHPSLAAAALVPCDDMMRMLTSQGPRHIIFFLDACRSDASRRVPRPAALWNIRNDAGVHERYALGRAAQAKALAYEVPIDAPRRGAFSQLLIEGLRQHRIDGRLTVQDLDDYVSRAMPELVKPYKQFPQIEEFPRPYTLVLAQGAPVGALPTARITYAAVLDGVDLLLVGGPQNVRIALQGGAEPYNIQLSPGSYVIETLTGAQVASFSHSGLGVTDVAAHA